MCVTDRLNGLSALITGASSGIGEATARLLASEGAKVVLFARREERIVRLAEELGKDALALPGDITSRDDVLSAVEKAVGRFGHIDVLVNNAGIMPLSAIAERRVDDWDRMIDVNIKGVLYAIDAVLPGMLSRDSGHVVNISSLAGWRVSPTSAVYAATKFAVRAISDGLRCETAGKIKVTAIYPGIVETELFEGVSSVAIRDKLEELKDRHAMPASAIAEAILYVVTQPPSVGVNDIIISPPGAP